MRKLIRFYTANLKIDGYTYNNIVREWTDYNLQNRLPNLTWLFPLESDEKEPLNKALMYKLKSNKNIQKNITKLIYRIMDMFGYNPELKEIKELNREEGKVKIGLYNTENYAIITRILSFLVLIGMTELSALFFRMLRTAIESDEVLKHIIKTKAVLSDWIETQPNLREHKYSIEEEILGEELEEWEKF